MKKFFIVCCLLIWAYFFKYFFLKKEIFLKSEELFVLGVLLLSAFLIASILKIIRFPRLTGYMLTGLLIGPEILNILTISDIENLHFFENLAIAFIAITAGRELKFKKLKKILKLVLTVLLNQMVFVFFGLFLILMPLSKIMLANHIKNEQILIGFSILFSATALSQSPAAVMGIITELKSKGKITDLVLNTTVLNTILIVLIFPIAITFSKTFFIPGFEFSIENLVASGTMIFSSVLLGIIIGLVIILFLRFVKVEKVLFLLLTGILITELSYLLELEILISSIVVGIVVENFSTKGDDLLISINKISLPLYIVFFTFAGASLKLETIRQAFFITFILILLRMVLFYLSSFFAAKWLKENNLIKDYLWMGFIGQAAIAIGLSNIIEKAIPGEVGKMLISILIATVVINEFLGPVFFKYLLEKAGETQVQIYKGKNKF